LSPFFRGKAKATFSFGPWKGIKVTPTTVEIAVDEPHKETGKQDK
jgi:hypothetical protein